MQTDTLTQEILALENRFFQAMMDRDLDAALALTAEPCIVTGAQGAAQIDKKAFAGMMEHGAWRLNAFEIADAKVQRLGPDVAIIGYRVREDLTVDGKPLTLEAADASTWIKQDGQWVCALHTESLLGDPYGRDRRPQS